MSRRIGPWTVVPRRVGPRRIGPWAQMSAPKKWTIGPQGNLQDNLQCIDFTDIIYFPNVGSLYPIQIYIEIYITKCTFPNPAPKGSTETL